MKCEVWVFQHRLCDENSFWRNKEKRKNIQPHPHVYFKSDYLFIYVQQMCSYVINRFYIESAKDDLFDSIALSDSNVNPTIILYSHHTHHRRYSKMLKALLYLTVLLQCGLSIFQGDDLRLVRLVTEATRQCLEDGDYCWDPEECCTGMIWILPCQSLSYHGGECSHHWPPTTTPVFGQCGPVPECQVSWSHQTLMMMIWWQWW